MEKVEALKVVVDTDIIIDYLKKRQPGTELLKKAYLKYHLHVTSITVYELLYGVQKSGKTNLINRLLTYVSVLSFDEAAANKAAALSTMPLQAKDWTLASRMPLSLVSVKPINFLFLREILGISIVYLT